MQHFLAMRLISAKDIDDPRLIYTYDINKIFIFQGNLGQIIQKFIWKNKHSIFVNTKQTNKVALSLPGNKIYNYTMIIKMSY